MTEIRASDRVGVRPSTGRLTQENRMPLSLSEARNRLRDLELFRECSDGDLDRVAAVAGIEPRFEPGEVRFAEGA